MGYPVVMPYMSEIEICQLCSKKQFAYVVLWSLILMAHAPLAWSRTLSVHCRTGSARLSCHFRMYGGDNNSVCAEYDLFLLNSYGIVQKNMCMPPNEILGIQMCNSGFMHFYGRPIMALYNAAIMQPSA